MPSVYSAKWRKLRSYHLHHQPLCVYCQAQGRVTAGTVVDHITPHRGDLGLAFDPSNLQTLCTTHHQAAKQTEEKRGYSIEIGVDGWPIDSKHPGRV